MKTRDRWARATVVAGGVAAVAAASWAHMPPDVLPRMTPRRLKLLTEGALWPIQSLIIPPINRGSGFAVVDVPESVRAALDDATRHRIGVYAVAAEAHGCAEGTALADGLARLRAFRAAASL